MTVGCSRRVFAICGASLAIGQYLTHLWVVKGQIFAKSVIFQLQKSTLAKGHIQYSIPNRMMHSFTLNSCTDMGREEVGDGCHQPPPPNVLVSRTVAAKFSTPVPLSILDGAWKFQPRSSKVSSPGHTEWPHLQMHFGKFVVLPKGQRLVERVETLRLWWGHLFVQVYVSAFGCLWL